MIDIAKLESLFDDDGIVFLTYGGFLTQSLIVGMTEALEKESEDSDLSMKIANNIYTVFIELSQNMMNYSKCIKECSHDFDPKGMVVVGKNSSDDYYVLSQNIVDIKDMQRMEPKLKGVIDADKDEIKRLYREARRSGKDTHGKGGGIGFYEIAKRCEQVEYSFTKINESKFYYRFKAIL